MNSTYGGAWGEKLASSDANKEGFKKYYNEGSQATQKCPHGKASY